MSRISRFGVACALVASATASLADPVSRPIATPVAADSRVIKVGTAIVSGVNAVSGSSAGYIMLFNAATVPADGAVTPVKCLPIAANTGLDVDWHASPMYLPIGAVLVFSTTGCFTKTTAGTASAFLSADMQ